MKEGWVLVYTTDQEFKAKIAEDVLKQQGLISHIVNKPDSAIPSIGSAALYAPAEQAGQALDALKEAGIISEEEE